MAHIGKEEDLEGAVVVAQRANGNLSCVDFGNICDPLTACKRERERGRRVRSNWIAPVPET